MPSLSLEYTLPLIARRPGEYADKPTGFVHEFDCELHINWWANEDDYGYELDYVVIDDGKKDRFIITKETDPVLWPCLVRGFEYEDRRADHLAREIHDHIHEALSDEIYEAAE